MIDAVFAAVEPRDTTTLFATIPADGMIDREIAPPSPTVTSVCFGNDADTFFVTTGRIPDGRADPRGTSPFRRPLPHRLVWLAARKSNQRHRVLLGGVDKEDSQISS